MTGESCEMCEHTPQTSPAGFHGKHNMFFCSPTCSSDYWASVREDEERWEQIERERIADPVKRSISRHFSKGFRRSKRRFRRQVRRLFHRMAIRPDYDVSKMS